MFCLVNNYQATEWFFCEGEDSINTANVGVALFRCMNISSVRAAIVDTAEWFLRNPP